MIGDPLDPLTQLYGQQPIPALPPEQAQSSIDQIGHGLLGGLGYIGDLLDKTFGGRAIRSVASGLTGGKFDPTELLSVLPGSDTLGLSDAANKVTGKQLLQNIGVVGKNPSNDNGFSTDDLLGIGAEALLDPSTYFGAAVPKLVAKGLGGASRGLNTGLATATAGRLDPLSYLGRQADRVTVPAKTLFDYASQGAITKPGQQIAADVFTPGIKAGADSAMTNYFNALSPIDEITKANPNALGAIQRATTDAAQGLVPRARQTLTSAGMAPDDIDQLINHTINYTDPIRSGTIAQERGIGALSKEASSVPDWLLGAQKAASDAGEALPNDLSDMIAKNQAVKYVPHTITETGDAIQNARSAGGGVSAITQHQIAREEALKGLGGINDINDLVKNPAMGPARASDQAVERELAKSLTGHDIGNLKLEHAFPPSWTNTTWGKEAWKGATDQIKDLSNKLKTYSDPVREKGLLSEDVFGNMAARQLASNKAVTGGQTIMAGLDPKLGQVKPISELQKVGQKFVSVPKFLEEAGLTHVDDLGNHVAGEAVGKLHGMSAKDMANYGVPRDVADDMLRIGKAWQAPEALKPILDTWDNLTQNVKGNLTYPFPGFHFRNVMSGLFNMWRAGALSPTAMKDVSAMQRGGKISDSTAAKLYPGLSVEDATKQLRNDMMGSNVAFTRNNQVSEVTGPTSAVRGGFTLGTLPEVGGEASSLAEGAKSLLSNYNPIGHMNPLDSKEFALTKGGAAVGNAAEDWLRGSHYLGERLKGSNAADAKLSTMKYQIDYNDLTQFEKNVMKRIFPFYSFSRRNLPPMLEDLAERPAKLAGGVRLSTSRQDNEFTPSWISEGTAIPIGKTPEGFNRYINALGMPYEDESVKALGNLASGKGARTLQTVLGQTNPIMKFLMEQGTGVQMHTGRKLADLRPSPIVAEAGDLVQGAGLDHPSTQTEQLLSELLSSTPASRFATTAGKLGDERKSLGVKALNLLTGTNFTDVDVPKTQQIAARDQIMDLLRGSPNVRHFEEFNVPKEKQAMLTPQELEAYQLYKSVEQKAKEAAAKKKQNQSGLALLPF